MDRYWVQLMEPRRQKSPWLVALLIVGLLVALDVALSIFSSKSSGPSYPKAWDPRIAPLAAIAAKDRGLTFDHPVYVDFLSPAEFAKQVTSGSKSLSPQDRKQVEQAQGMLRALGLISDRTDLLKQMNTLNSSGILGLYSPEDKRIRVRGAELTPAVKVTLVHELTHVLQDQHFNLSATTKKLDASETEDGSAFHALVEGDARRIENEYRSSLPKAVQAQLDQSDSADSAAFAKASKNVPGFLVTEMGAPYDLGEIAVTRAFNGGGNAAVDALFGTPPNHQIQAMQPWLMGTTWTSPALSKPQLGGGETQTNRGEFGAFDLYLVLAQRIPVKQALAAADGWGADQYLSYSKAGRSCVRSAFTGETASDTQRLRAALVRWTAESAGSATVSSAGATLTLNACDSGENYRVPADHSSAAMDLLSTRNAIEMQVEKDGTPQDVAVCFVKAVAQHFSLATLNADTVPPAIENQIHQIAGACGG